MRRSPPRLARVWHGTSVVRTKPCSDGACFECDVSDDGRLCHISTSAFVGSPSVAVTRYAFEQLLADIEMDGLDGLLRDRGISGIDFSRSWTGGFRFTYLGQSLRFTDAEIDALVRHPDSFRERLTRELPAAA